MKNSTKEKVLSSISKLEKLDEVYSAEPNYYVEPASVPNDYYYSNGSQWNLNASSGINIEGAWDFTQGDSNVRVGIIDTGIANHVELNNNLREGYDFYNNNATTNDDSKGHGTKVAGVIGAQGNNNIGIAGINWSVSLVPMQCSYYENNILYISSDSTIRAINWATNLWGTDQQIDIINYSVSGFGKNFAVLNAVSSYPGLFGQRAIMVIMLILLMILIILI